MNYKPRGPRSEQVPQPVPAPATLARPMTGPSPQAEASPDAQTRISARFLRFCAVGASGVGVNLGALWLLTQLMGLQQNLASALAIELSILSNFVFNDAWTFSDRHRRAWWARATSFHAVAALGALVQWVSFVGLNVLLLRLFFPADWSSWLQEAQGAWLRAAVASPPEVGIWKYFSQLCGIALAVGWNFLANFYLTWGTTEGGETPAETNP